MNVSALEFLVVFIILIAYTFSKFIDIWLTLNMLQMNVTSYTLSMLTREWYFTYNHPELKMPKNSSKKDKSSGKKDGDDVSMCMIVMLMFYKKFCLLLALFVYI